MVRTFAVCLLNVISDSGFSAFRHNIGVIGKTSSRTYSSELLEIRPCASRSRMVRRLASQCPAPASAESGYPQNQHHCPDLLKVLAKLPLLPFQDFISSSAARSENDFLSPDSRHRKQFLLQIEEAGTGCFKFFLNLNQVILQFFGDCAVLFDLALLEETLHFCWILR
jgi:hypothetical protein